MSERPMVKCVLALAAPYTPLPRFTPSALTVTLTVVPLAQYFAGRQCRVCLSSQKNLPSTDGDASMTTAFSAAALSPTALLNRTHTGWPTP
jgi:hypothetical protein